MNFTGKLSTASSEHGLYVEWSISNFSCLLQEKTKSYSSPSFLFEGEYWQLLIFPNNRHYPAYDIPGYTDLGLCRCNKGPSIRLEICLSFKPVNGEKYLERHATKIFPDTNLFDTSVIYRFLKRSELLRRRVELLPSDVLTVVCTLKKTTSQGSASKHTNAECSFCKKTFDPVSLLPHENKCIERPMKCPQCSKMILFQDRYGHDCQTAEAEGELCANLQRDLKDLFIKQEDTDVIINVKGHEFMAHRIILKSRSPVFASTFRHSMKENATGVLEIEDCDPASFSDFLCFLYCGNAKIVSHENAFGLFFAADKYEVLDLRAKCLEFITKNLSVEIFCETITLAMRYSETKLIELSSDFFIENAEEILETVKWQTFVDENPTKGNELFLKYVQSVKQSNA